jgi:ferredoxin-thioredoxin reductase catalytic subunit
MGGNDQMSNIKSTEDVQAYVKRISDRNGWKLNVNQDILMALIDGLRDNFNRLGYFNCPCRDSQEDPHIDKDIICPCRYSKADIEEYGHCYCALYFTSEYDQSKPLRMIPERRP